MRKTSRLMIVVVVGLAVCGSTRRAQSGPSLSASQGQAAPARTPPPMTVDDVLRLVAAGLGDDVIIAQLKKSGKPLALSADDLIRLKTKGVSDALIRVMIDPQSPTGRSADGATVNAETPAQDLPSAKQAEMVLQSRITGPLAAQLRLVEFQKTDGQLVTLGVRQYRLEFKAELEFLNDAMYAAGNFGEPLKGIEVQAPGPTSEDGKFRGWDAWFNTTQGGRRAAYKGDRLNLAGAVAFERKESGWVAVDVSFHSTADSASRAAGHGPDGSSAGPRARPSPSAVVPSVEAAVPALEGAVSSTHADGSALSIGLETAVHGFRFGGTRVLTLTGERSRSRIVQGDPLLLRTPTPRLRGFDSGWYQNTPMEDQLAVYPLEVSNGKRTARMKEGVACSVERPRDTSQPLKIVVSRDLNPGEYALGPAKAAAPSATVNQFSVVVFTFGVDAPGATASPLAGVSARPIFPVIFIHGINSDADEAWGELRSDLVGRGWVFGGWPGVSDTGKVEFRLHLAGSSDSRADFYTMNMSDSNWHASSAERLRFHSQTLTFEQQGLQLAKVIRKVRAVNGVAKVILVGHSMGGLAARAYMQSLGTNVYEDDVYTLITVGTPHRGSPMARLSQDLALKAVPFFLEINPQSPAVRDLQESSAALASLNDQRGPLFVGATALPPEPLYATIAGVKTLLGSPTSGLGDSGAGDGLGSLSSQTFLPSSVARHIVKSIEIRCRPRSPDDLVQVHTCETHDRAVWTEILAHLEPPAGRQQ